MKKSLIYIIFAYVFLYSPLTSLYSQDHILKKQYEFEASIILGVNFSQLSGDNLSGYNLVGIKAGTEINYGLSRKNGIIVGLLYQEKGSSSSFALPYTDMSQITKLSYLCIPLSYYWDSAFRPTIQRYRIRMQVGLSLNRLFQVTSDNPIIQDNIENFSTFDFAAHGRITYQVSQKSAIALEFEHSLKPILSARRTDQLPAIASYLFSFQYLYRL